MKKFVELTAACVPCGSDSPSTLQQIVVPVWVPGTLEKVPGSDLIQIPPC